MPLSAAAGPWPAPEDGQIILQAAVGEEEGRSETEAQLYAETPGRFATQTTKIWAREDLTGLTTEATLGLRRPFSAPFADAFAVEGGLVAIHREDLGFAAGAELHGAIGWDWANGVYAAAEAGGRVEEAGASPRWEATLGRNGRRSLVFVQAHREDGQPGESFTRAELAAVWFGEGALGFQVGFRAGLGHDETAFTIGLWRRTVRP